MKRVFVTGATGFIGAAVASRLASDGYHVAALVRPEANLSRLGEWRDRIRLIHGTLAASTTYEDALADFSPDTVMHLGWHGVGKGARDDPDQIYVNVPDSLDLFLTAQRAGCRTFIGAGSQAEYGRSTQPLSEDSPIGPATLYGAAKFAAYSVLSRLAITHCMRFAWLRLFSVYGPQDHDSTLISYFVRELLLRHRPAVSAGSHLWDYLYIDDAAQAFVDVAERKGSGIYNVASGSARPLRETLQMIRDHIDPGLQIGFGEASVSHAQPLQASVARLRALGWSPATPLSTGIRNTVAWRRSIVGAA